MYGALPKGAVKVLKMMIYRLRRSYPYCTIHNLLCQILPLHLGHLLPFFKSVKNHKNANGPIKNNNKTNIAQNLNVFLLGATFSPQCLQ